MLPLLQDRKLQYTYRNTKTTLKIRVFTDVISVLLCVFNCNWDRSGIKYYNPMHKIEKWFFFFFFTKQTHNKWSNNWTSRKCNIILVFGWCGLKWDISKASGGFDPFLPSTGLALMRCGKWKRRVVGKCNREPCATSETLHFGRSSQIDVTCHNVLFSCKRFYTGCITNVALISEDMVWNFVELYDLIS